MLPILTAEGQSTSLRHELNLSGGKPDLLHDCSDVTLEMYFSVAEEARRLHVRLVTVSELIET